MSTGIIILLVLTSPFLFIIALVVLKMLMMLVAGLGLLIAGAFAAIGDRIFRQRAS